MIAEPVTLLTDYALAAWSAWLGYRMAKGSPWRAALFAMAAAALFGGTWHGFQFAIPEPALTILWKVTLACIGFVSVFLLTGAARDFLSEPWTTRLTLLARVKLLLFLTWIIGHDTFAVAVADYLPSLIVCGILAFSARHRHPGARWVLAGILLTLAGTAIQQSGLKICNNFNHNDLYHIIQIVSNTLLSRAGRSVGRSGSSLNI